MTKTSLYEYGLDRMLDRRSGQNGEETDYAEDYEFEAFDDPNYDAPDVAPDPEDAFALPLISFLGASTITAIAGAFSIAHGGAPVSQTLLFCITWVIATCMLLVLGDHLSKSDTVVRLLQRSLIWRMGGSVVCAFAALSVSILSYQIVDQRGAARAATVAASAIPPASAVSVAAPAEIKSPEPVKVITAAQAVVLQEQPKSVHYRRQHVSHETLSAAVLPAPVAPDQALLQQAGAAETAISGKLTANSKQKNIAGLSIDPDPLQKLSETHTSGPVLSIDPKPEVGPSKKKVKKTRKVRNKRARVKPAKRTKKRRIARKIARKPRKRVKLEQRKPQKKTLKRAVSSVASKIKNQLAPKQKRVGKATVTPASAKPRSRSIGRAGGERPAS